MNNLILVLISIMLFQSCAGSQSNEKLDEVQRNNRKSSIENNLNNDKNPVSDNSADAVSQSKNQSMENKQDIFLITPENFGNVKIGITVGNLKHIYPQSKIEVVSNPIDKAIFTNAVKDNGITLFYFDVGKEENTLGEPAKDTEKISRIIIDDTKAKTAANAGVGMTFGKVKEMYPSLKYVVGNTSASLGDGNKEIKKILFFSIPEKSENTPPTDFDPSLKITHIVID